MSKYVILILWAMALVLSLFGSSLDGYVCASATAAIAIGAGASLLGGLVSDYINTKSQADTNVANREIAQENREWQSKENQIARDWSERQWNLNNQYNTPSAIAKRQREAGFNPYLLGSSLGQGQSQPTQANTNATAPEVPQMIAPRVGATAGAMQNVNSQIANFALYKEGVDANAANQQTQSDLNAVNVANAMRKVYGDNKIDGKPADEWYLERHFSVHGNTDNNLEYNSAVTNLKRSQHEEKLANIRASLEQEFGRKKVIQALAQSDQSISESAARIGKMASDASLNESKKDLLIKQAKTEGEKYWTEIAKQFNLRKQGEYFVASADQLHTLLSYTKERMDYENQILRRRNSEDLSRYRSRSLIRNWQESDDGQTSVFENFEIGQDVFLNQADKVIKTISPITPSMNINNGSYDYHRFYGE